MENNQDLLNLESIKNMNLTYHRKLAKNLGFSLGKIKLLLKSSERKRVDKN